MLLLIAVEIKLISVIATQTAAINSDSAPGAALAEFRQSSAIRMAIEHWLRGRDWARWCRRFRSATGFAKAQRCVLFHHWEQQENDGGGGEAQTTALAMAKGDQQHYQQSSFAPPATRCYTTQHACSYA